MKAEIMAVGTEVLMGDIVNTNAQYIARRLADLGIGVYYHSAVGDNSARLKDSLALGFSRVELIIATGGLGPTKDDLTKETAAAYFNRKLILHEESYLMLTQYFEKQGREVSENNKKQAYMPEGSVVLPNPNGTAPGCILKEGDKILVLLPGPPREMKPMFENYVVPYLEKYQDSILVSKVLRICGIGEGHMVEKIAHIIDNQSNPTVAPYAKEGEVTLRITAKAENMVEAKRLIEPMEREIRNILGEDIYAVGETTLEDVVGELLVNKKLTISTAESCTGGMLSGRLINYPGISASYLEGVVTYSNEAKMKYLGVKEETLDSFGAVSEETAREMAEGIAKAAGTDIGVSVTGIAGPGGGTEDKPVGLVYVGLYIRGKVEVKKLNLSGDRQKVRNRTVVTVLDWIRREISKL
ncbi:competence/damage-inducible protein A [Clostridium omnivorum]|uniref:Putative competence-damage inducible protein n=1 Tax=Clostridium omnivorum TaxID=1604902 RepID=A0ABQ5N3T3_9CLOT|nr:competence/damage-inducible protein A [Clostridium sp. E14]GLC29869.1 putative competence-damage inducible protein [Clostridium sp. E14]